jgi:hypothetical protein
MDADPNQLQNRWKIFLSLRRIVVMDVKEFLSLEYKDQLSLINESGKLKLSFIVNDYQFTLYKVKGIYVEMKRNIKDLFFERITAMNYEDLPNEYK